MNRKDPVQRYKEKTYRQFTVMLRKEDDKELLEWYEAHKDEHRVADIFRVGIRTLMKK